MKKGIFISVIVGIAVYFLFQFSFLWVIANDVRVENGVVTRAGKIDFKCLGAITYSKHKTSSFTIEFVNVNRVLGEDVEYCFIDNKLDSIKFRYFLKTIEISNSNNVQLNKYKDKAFGRLVEIRKKFPQVSAN
jgi:hypothetical protein